MSFFKNLMLKIPSGWRDALPHWLQRRVKTHFQRRALKTWDPNSQTPPPHLLKVQRILELQNQHLFKTFIETGTYMGDMIDAVHHAFPKLHSIELAPKYYHRAVKIFNQKPHIQLHLGDSGKVLPKILKKLKQPALIWLDAHYSGAETAGADKNAPILKELTHIFKNKHKHLVLIDDARLFTGKEGYPSLKKLEKFVKKHSDYQLTVKDDAIWLM